MSEVGITKSKSLKELQNNLLKLSDKLNATYNFLKNCEKKLGESWKDNKYSEFEQEFARSREIISNLSKKYKEEWANKTLPPIIKAAEEYEGMSATLGE